MWFPKAAPPVSGTVETGMQAAPLEVFALNTLLNHLFLSPLNAWVFVRMDTK